MVKTSEGQVGHKTLEEDVRSLFPALAKALRSRQTITGKGEGALAGRRIGALNEVENFGT